MTIPGTARATATETFASVLADRASQLWIRSTCQPDYASVPVLAMISGLPMGSSKDLDTAKADFKAAWERLLARTSSEELAAAYKSLNIRDDG